MRVTAVDLAVERAARTERAAVLAAVARDVRDLELAQDAVQEALLAALDTWPRTGVPDCPGAWLTTVARRAALRALRRGARVRPADGVVELLAAVLGVVYLIFTEGHAATSGADRVRAELCDEAVRLARLIAVLLPSEPEALGLAALVLAHDARRPARVDSTGRTVPLEEQDRSRYDRARVLEAAGLLGRAILSERSGPYQLQAAIAVLHASAPGAADTDWAQIAVLYGALERVAPSPMVALNRAAAVAMADGPEAGLALVDGLRAGPGALDDHHLLHATRAELLRRAGRPVEAAAAYRRALELAPAEGTARGDLARRLDELG